MKQPLEHSRSEPKFAPHFFFFGHFAYPLHLLFCGVVISFSAQTQALTPTSTPTQTPAFARTKNHSQVLAPIPTPCQTLKKIEGQLHLQKCDNLKILTLTGTPVERSRAHGALIGNEFTRENIELFKNLALRDQKKDSLTYKFAERALQALAWWGQRSAPQIYHDEITAFADAAQIPVIDVQRALMLPDLVAFSWAMTHGRADWLPVFGCTSAAIKDQDGNYFQGRNLDFAGSPSFEGHPLLVVHIPEPGSKELKHVAIGTEGLHYGGISGFNEAGITFAVHQNYTKRRSFSGPPMPYIGDLVLRSAHTLEDALEILKKNPPGPLWTFVISDLKTQEIMSVEISNQEMKVRRSNEPVFAQTNFLVNEDLRKNLSMMDFGTWTNARFRFEKVLSTLNEWKSPSIEKMSQLLAYQKNHEVFSPIDDIQKTLSLQSVMYEKQKGQPAQVYITIDAAPAPSGRWIQFSMDDIFTSNLNSNPQAQVHDFFKQNPKIRDFQKKWAEVYSWDISRKTDKLLENLPSLTESPDSFLALAALQLQNKLDREALVSAQDGLNKSKLEAFKDTSPLTVEALKWVELASLWNMDKKDLVLTKALSLHNQGISNPAIKVEVQKLLKKSGPSNKSLRAGFDFFGGSLLGMPSAATE